MQDDQLRIVACPHPFTMERIEGFEPAGKTIREVLDAVNPEIGRSITARVFVNDMLILEDRWAAIIPPPESLIVVRAVPTGGSGGGNKFLRSIAFIALMAVSAYVGFYVSTTMAMGATAGAIAAGAMSMVGSMLINALIPPSEPMLDNLTGLDNAVSHSISGSRNQINRYGPIPVILGRHRVIPPHGAMPYTEIEGDDIYLRQIFVIGYGPLQLSDLKIGEDSLDNFTDIDVEVREGYDTDDSITLFTEDVYEEALDIALIQSESFSTQTTQADADEIVVDIVFKSGLFDLNANGALAAPVTVNFEIQYAPTGTSNWSIAYDYEAVGAQQSSTMSTPPSYEGEWGLLTGVRWNLICINKSTGVIRTIQGSLQMVYLHYTPGIGQVPVPVCPSTHAPIAKVFRIAGEDTIAAGRITDLRDSSLDKENAGDFLPSATGPVSNKIDIAAGGLRIRPHATAAKKSLIRFSHRFNLPSQGQYDVQIRRVTADGAFFNDLCHWSVLRSITAGDPINKSELAMVAIRIRATDQLSGIIDQFNCVATSICTDWDSVSETWVERPTANPASLFRHILQGPANKRALADSRINLTDLQDWHDRCKPTAQLLDNAAAVDKGGGKVGIPVTGHGYADDTTIYLAGTTNYDGQYSVDGDSTTDEVVIVATYSAETFTGTDEVITSYGKAFNMPVDFKTSVDDILRRVAGVGKATPAYKDGQWTIVEDKTETTVIQHFTPRNSWGFSSRKTFIEMPHALRVRFLNENEDWREDERIVYDDGYNVGNATLFEQIEFPGVTSPEQIHVLGRYHIAAAKLRPEVYSWFVDVEHIVCTRGDLVRVAYDAPLWGVAWGRVKSRTVDGSTITHIEVDNICTMEAGSTYTCRFRLSDGTTRIDSIVLNIGEQTTLEFTTPIAIASAPAMNDLFLFGETGSESAELVIKSIEPSSDLSARITAVDYDAAIHLSDTATIPAYSTDITLPYDAATGYGAPGLQSIVSDESVMIRDADGSLKIRMVVTLKYVLSPAEVNRTIFKYRPENSTVAWQSIEINGWGRQIWVTDIEQGITYEYEIQYRFLRTGEENAAGRTTYFSLTAATTGTHTIIGKSSNPDVPTGFSATAVPKGIRLDWTSPVGLDLSGVAIWRAASDSFPGGSAKYLVYASPGETIAFVDRNVAYDTTYYYWIKAVDTSGNLSTVVGSANAQAARVVTDDVDDAQISSAKIVDAIQSENFVTDTSGWYIGFRSTDDGYAEFNDVVIRGVLAAGEITASGGLIVRTGGDIILDDGGDLIFNSGSTGASQIKMESPTDKYFYITTGENVSGYLGIWHEDGTATAGVGNISFGNAWTGSWAYKRLETIDLFVAERILLSILDYTLDGSGSISIVPGEVELYANDAWTVGNNTRITILPTSVEIKSTAGTDPKLIFDIAGTDKFAIGVDDNDGDRLKLQAGGSLDTTSFGIGFDDGADVIEFMAARTLGSEGAVNSNLKLWTFQEDTVADDDYIDLPGTTDGFLLVSVTDGSSYSESALFSINSAGVCSLCAGDDTQFDDAQTDGYFCVWDNGTAARMENKLGGTYAVRSIYWYN